MLPSGEPVIYADVSREGMRLPPGATVLEAAPSGMSPETAVCLGSIPLFGHVGLPTPAASGLMASFVTATGNVELWKAAIAEALGGHIGYNGPSPSPGGETVYLCYFDGDFGRPRGPQASGVPDWSRVVIEIDSNGLIDLLVGGFKEDTPVIDPNRTGQPSPTEGSAYLRADIPMPTPETATDATGSWAGRDPGVSADGRIPRPAVAHLRGVAPARRVGWRAEILAHVSSSSTGPSGRTV